MVTLKSGRRVRRASAASSNAPSTSSASDRPAAASRLRSTTDSDSSLPNIPPLGSAAKSANKPVVVDIREDTPPPARVIDEESDEEGPDYEPVGKRAKPGSSNGKGKAVAKPGTSNAKGKAAAKPPIPPAPVVLYDLTEDPEEDVVEDSDDEELAGVTFVNVTTEQTIVVLDDDDDDVNNDDEPQDIKNVLTEDATTAANATTAENGTTEANTDIIVNETSDKTTNGPSRKRHPVTAHIEEIVPKKYRTL